MAVINPDHLLDQARRLLAIQDARGLVRQVERRRAISAAYYAVFHYILIALADELVGRRNRKSPRYALVYRRLDHTALEGLCKEVRKTQMAPKYVSYVPASGWGENIREFASLVVELKEKRNAADYDPGFWVKIADANQAIESANSAIAGFECASVIRKKAFLTLLLFPPR
jgi:hypothetical protein